MVVITTLKTLWTCVWSRPQTPIAPVLMLKAWNTASGSGSSCSQQRRFRHDPARVGERSEGDGDGDGQIRCVAWWWKLPRRMWVGMRWSERLLSLSFLLLYSNTDERKVQSPNRRGEDALMNSVNGMHDLRSNVDLIRFTRQIMDQW